MFFFVAENKLEYQKCRFAFPGFTRESSNEWQKPDYDKEIFIFISVTVCDNSVKLYLYTVR